MKKNIFTVLVIATISIAATSFYLSSRNCISSLAKANIEALASDENIFIIMCESACEPHNNRTCTIFLSNNAPVMCQYAIPKTY